MTNKDGTLDKRAIKAILCHELTHIKHLHSLQDQITNILYKVVRFGVYLEKWVSKKSPLLGALLSVFFYPKLLFSSVSRQCEYIADATAVKCGYKRDLKRALAKLAIGNTATIGNTKTQGVIGWSVRIITGALSLFNEYQRTHPSIKNRFLAIKAESARVKALNNPEENNGSFFKQLGSELKEALRFEVDSCKTHFTLDNKVMRASVNDLLKKEERQQLFPV